MYTTSTTLVDADDDLADHLGLGHVLVRLLGLLEAEDAVDERVEVGRLEEVDEVLEVLPRADEDAAEVRRLEEDGHLQVGRLAGREVADAVGGGYGQPREGSRK